MAYIIVQTDTSIQTGTLSINPYCTIYPVLVFVLFCFPVLYLLYLLFYCFVCLDYISCTGCFIVLFACTIYPVPVVLLFACTISSVPAIVLFYTRRQITICLRLYYIFCICFFFIVLFACFMSCTCC